MLRFYLVFFVIIKNLFFTTQEKFLCSEEYCKSYVEQNECISVSPACLVQNATYNGEEFPGAVPCNCCKTCLENLNEGEYCTIGSPDTAPPMLVCGPGLYCTISDNNKDYVCKKMVDSPCFKAQIQYDKDKNSSKVGSFMQRPSCDGDGNFGPIKCTLGQSCFCVDNKGERIFGEALHTPLTELTMRCECSRLNSQFTKTMKFNNPALTSRCLENGSFDPMQCIDDKCICVESSSGAPESSIYNMTERSFDLLTCFNRSIHRAYIYPHDCEIIQGDLLQEIQDSKDEGYTIFDVEFPSCQPDGWFAPIQEDEESLYCADKYGRKIGSYSVLKTSPNVEEINCKCARTQYLLKKQNASVTFKCCPNGNFEKVQCREDNCYCVDEDGLQISKEVPKTEVQTLHCYHNGNMC